MKAQSLSEHKFAVVSLLISGVLPHSPMFMRAFSSGEKFPVSVAVKFAVIVGISELNGESRNGAATPELASATLINAKSAEGSVLTLVESQNSNNLLNFRWRSCVSRWQVETFSSDRKEAVAGTDTCVHGTVRLPCEIGNGT